MEQRAASLYPFVWPLPMPVEDFIYRAHDEASWVADDEGGVAGHVSVGLVTDDDDGNVFTRALGAPADKLRIVSTLFTSAAARGRGVGSALLTRTENHIVERGLIPVLDVVPAHSTAQALYRRRGWHEIASGRPSWLPDGAPDVRYLALTQA